MHCRPYRATDRTECLEVFTSHANAGPDWGITYVESEEVEYESFLDQLPGPYYVVVDGPEVIAAGGFAARATPRQADLQWWAVRRSRRHEGAGSLLMSTCVNDLIADPFIDRVQLVTTNESRGFFERWGFKATGAQYDTHQIRNVEMRFELDEPGKQQWTELITGGLDAPDAEVPIPAIEKYKDWSAHRYDPGYYLGGNLEPHLDQTRLGNAGRRRSGLLLAITATITTFAYGSFTESGWERLGWAAMSAVSWIAAYRMFRSGTMPDNR